MTLEGNGRYFQSEASRTVIYVSQRIAKDSAWPFTPGQQLHIKIDGDKLIVASGETSEPDDETKSVN